MYYILYEYFKSIVINIINKDFINDIYAHNFIV